MVTDNERYWNQFFALAQHETVSLCPASTAQGNPSLDWIRNLISSRTGIILDVGGAASTLVEALLLEGYRNVKVLDIACTALVFGKRRLGKDARRVEWIRADVLQYAFPKRSIDLWHDQSVFQFLVDAQDRNHYITQLRSVLKTRGTAIIATVSLDGPETLCGLPVIRYAPESLASTLGPEFSLLDTATAVHQISRGESYPFQYSCFKKC